MTGNTLAITNGQPDGEGHPYVGLLVFEQDYPELGYKILWRCSGALISPNVVWTAGHCTNGAQLAWAIAEGRSCAPGVDEFLECN